MTNSFLFKTLLLDFLSLKLSSLGQASHRAMLTLSGTVVSLQIDCLSTINQYIWDKGNCEINLVSRVSVT